MPLTSNGEFASPTIALSDRVLADSHELVMAWAKDSKSGELRYILELGPHQRGARSGCECISCNLPLTAVNAAKST